MKKKLGVSKKKKIFRKKKGFSIKISNSTKIGSESSIIQKSPLPARFSCVHKYAQTFTLTTGTVGVMGTQNSFRLNCMYDPDATGTGHQPYGYDQMVALYNGYQVKAVKVTLIWSTVGASSEVMGAYTTYPDLGGTSLTGFDCDTCTERPNVNTILLSPSGNNRVVEQNFYTKIHNIFAIPQKEYDDLSYISSNVVSASSPAKQCFVTISAGSPSLAGGVACTCQIIIHYYAEWNDVQGQSAS